MPYKRYKTFLPQISPRSIFKRCKPRLHVHWLKGGRVVIILGDMSSFPSKYLPVYTMYVFHTFDTTVVDLFSLVQRTFLSVNINPLAVDSRPGHMVPAEITSTKQATDHQRVKHFQNRTGTHAILKLCYPAQTKHLAKWF